MKLQVLQYDSAARVPGERLPIPQLPLLAGAVYSSSGLTAVLNPDARFITLRNFDPDLGVAIRLGVDGLAANPLLDVVIFPREEYSFGIRNAFRGDPALRLSLVEVSV